MKKSIVIAGIGLLLFAGTALLFYPDISNWLAERNHSTAVQEYNAASTEIAREQIEAEKQKAREYNDALSGTQIKDPFVPGSGMVLPENYSSVLDVHGTIGYIEIPAINVSLPIYHGTGDAVLKRGVGHMETTAFPIGGKGNHTVLMGHTGLSSARLFSDLDKLMIEDRFYIHILDETLAYEVTQMLVVVPENTEDLRPVKDEDRITLITCTPYSINSHRLLVQGMRVPYIADEAEQKAIAPGEPIDWRIVVTILLVVASSVLCFTYKCTNRVKKRKLGEKKATSRVAR